MAANTFTALIPKLLAQGLLALRQNAVTAQMVNRAYEAMAGQKGSTIDVPIPSAITSASVTPGVTAPDPAGMVPTTVPIQLNNWKEAAFTITDKEELEVMNGVLPMQASEAIKVLANDVDDSILSMYKKFYGFHGTPGTTPFASGTTTDATQLRKVLNMQLAPLDPRWVVFDPAAEANMLDVRAFHDMSFTGDASAIREGRLERRLGFGWVMNQNVPTHTKGTEDGAYQVDDAGGALSVGDTAIVVKTGTGTMVEGDIITFAGHSQTYVITTNFAGGAGTINIQPGLVAVPADGAAITVKDSHVANLAFHRDAIAFATRPLQSHGASLGVISQSAVDPISGLTLRVEVKHEYKRLRYSYDILWGVAVIRRELGARLAG